MEETVTKVTGTIKVKNLKTGVWTDLSSSVGELSLVPDPESDFNLSNLRTLTRTTSTVSVNLSKKSYRHFSKLFFGTYLPHPLIHNGGKPRRGRKR